MSSDDTSTTGRATPPTVAVGSRPQAGVEGAQPSSGRSGPGGRVARLRDRPTALALAATVLAAVVGLWDLGRRSFWYDEAFTVGIVDRPIGDVLWRITHWEVNQSPYYLLFAGWFRLGQSEELLRLLSVAFAVAAVPAIYLLGRRLVDTRVGAVAALLLALHPLVVQWGQQLRSYSMAVFMVILATLALLRAVDEPDDARRSVLYGIVAAVTIYTHFFALLVVVAHLVWVSLVRPMPKRVVVAAGAALGVLVLPLVGYLLTYEGDPLIWLAGRRDDAVLATARGLTGGRGMNLVAYALATAAGVWAVYRGARSAGSIVATAPGRADATTGATGDGGATAQTAASWLPAARSSTAWRPVLVLLWVVLPLAVTTLATYAAKPLLEARFLIVVVPGLVLLAAHGLCRLPWRLVAGVLLAALVLVSLSGVRTWHRGPVLEDWRAAVPAAIERAGADGALVLDPRLSLFAVRYYLPDGASFTLAGPDFGAEPRPSRLVEVVRIHQQPHELQPLYFLWRDTYYEEVDQQAFAGLTVTTYRARP